MKRQAGGHRGAGWRVDEGGGDSVIGWRDDWMAAKDVLQTNSIKSHIALPGQMLDPEIRNF